MSICTLWSIFDTYDLKPARFWSLSKCFVQLICPPFFHCFNHWFTFSSFTPVFSSIGRLCLTQIVHNLFIHHLNLFYSQYFNFIYVILRSKRRDRPLGAIWKTALGLDDLLNSDDILHLHHTIDLMDAPITIIMTNSVYLIVIHKASQHQLPH